MAKKVSKTSGQIQSTTAPPNITDLIRRFADHAEAYHVGRYNETQIRREFIDPLFKELGWDMDNSQGYAEAYKDVIHEDAIKIGGVTKAPDYCFRIGGVRKFFVEAKKPSVDIKDDTSPAYQLRRYAWSAKLPLSILTDFEELAVYDCRIKPAKTDKASKAVRSTSGTTNYPTAGTNWHLSSHANPSSKVHSTNMPNRPSANVAPPRSMMSSSKISNSGATRSPATLRCATLTSSSENSTSPSSAPSTVSSFCASVRIAASSSTARSKL